MHEERGQDADGKESSKRYWAKILITNGMIMSWIAFLFSCLVTIISMTKSECNNVQVVDTELIYLQLLTGLGALGFTLGERFNRK